MDDHSAVLKDLGRAIDDYLHWMNDQMYCQQTIGRHKQTLSQFFVFTETNELAWDEIFTFDTLKLFERVNGLKWAPAVRGLSRHLFEQGKISRPISKRKASIELPDIYEQYLLHHKQYKQVSEKKISAIRRVLVPFCEYLQKEGIRLCHLRIEHLDAFLVEFNKGFLSSSCKAYRNYLRGFLSYLYDEHKILTRHLAPLVIGAPMFSKSKPPQFLRSHEVENLFASLKLDSAKDLRTYAIVNLSYSLGLRPAEIRNILLDDISFSKAQLIIRDRKTNNPTILPVPEPVVKAVAAYLIGARPKSKSRFLFLSLQSPHGPLDPGRIGSSITECMKHAGICGTAYWLRHTYAQNLLEAGTSIYEIKEMMGHHSIESTREYLSIHIELMREVLFDEKL
jgi:site-specific recombinase XerD